MPFYANTPESLLGRSDSKNPATTCRGITSSGRPCRRPIAAAGPAPAAPLTPKRRKTNLRVDDPSDPDLYCWQHKEQANLSAHSSPGPRISNTPILEERKSLDTLADRLGIVAAQQDGQGVGQHGRPQKQNGQTHGGHGGNPPRPTKTSRPKPKKEVEFCFCFRLPLEEASPPPRPKPRPVQPPSMDVPHRPSTSSVPAGKIKPSAQYLNPSAAAASSRPHRPSVSSAHTSGGGSSQHSSTLSTTSSQTAQYLSLIPPTTSPQTASQLMAELAKPPSQQDDPGYIYIFWLTPETESSAPPVDAARSMLLAPPVTPTWPSTGQRRASDVLAAFAAMNLDDGPSFGPRGLKSGSNEDGGKKLLLKIGRATNVQRRLNEWQRQCGYNLSLIRYYPYIPSGSPAAVPRKMPHSHKVERLIHLELTGLGMRVADREKCEACGKEHREWFKVDATRDGIAGVDEIVRRWVEWDEAQV